MTIFGAPTPQELPCLRRVSVALELSNHVRGSIARRDLLKCMGRCVACANPGICIIAQTDLRDLDPRSIASRNIVALGYRSTVLCAHAARPRITASHSTLIKPHTSRPWTKALVVKMSLGADMLGPREKSLDLFVPNAA